MDTIIITPQICEEYIPYDKKPIITFSKYRIVFSLAAVKKLALKADDKFILEIKDNKLYYKDTTKSRKAFQTYLSGKNILAASASGLLRLLFIYKIVPEMKTTKFIIDEFKDGAYRLNIVLPKKTDNDVRKI